MPELNWQPDPGSLSDLMDGDAGIVTSIGFPWGRAMPYVWRRDPRGARLRQRAGRRGHLPHSLRGLCDRGGGTECLTAPAT